MKSPGARKAVTAKDVAQACGVSQATVSYVINNAAGSRISEETRQKVLEVSRQLGYFPSSIARSMRIKRSMSVGVVLGGNSLSLSTMHVLRGVKRILDAAGYVQVLFNQEDCTSEECIRQFRSGRVDAMLFLFLDMPEELTSALNAAAIPYLVASEQGISGNGIDMSNGYDAAVGECVDLIKKNNWKKVKFFSFRKNGVLYSCKFNFFRKILDSEFGESEMQRVVVDVDGLDDEQILALLEKEIEREGFDIAITPHVRLGWMVQNAILRCGLCMPQKIKHICLQTAHPFMLAYPSITMIDVPLTELGTFTARMLLDMLSGASHQADYTPGELPRCRLREGMSTL